MRRCLVILAFLAACSGREEDPPSSSGESSVGEAPPETAAKKVTPDASTEEPSFEKQPPFPWVASCPSAPSSSFAPSLVAVDVKKAFVGHWRGTVTAPRVPPYEASFAFDADGHYASRSLDDAFFSALFYGTDDDTPLKRYRIGDREIDVVFEYDADVYALAAWQGVLGDIQIDGSNDRLHFTLSRSDEPGTIAFDLWRCP